MALIEHAIENPLVAVAIVALFLVIFYVALRGPDDNWRSPGPYKWAIGSVIFVMLGLLLTTF